MPVDKFYQNKYLKYKNKYLNLKKMTGGVDINDVMKYAPVAAAVAAVAVPLLPGIINAAKSVVNNKEVQKVLSSNTESKESAAIATKVVNNPATSSIITNGASIFSDALKVVADTAGTIATR